MLPYVNSNTISGTINLPPSKSLAHRFMIAGMLSPSCVLHGIDLSNDEALCEDLIATRDILMQLAGKMCGIWDADTYSENTCSDDLQKPLDCHESGSTLRFLIPLLLLQKRPYTLIGSPRLFERPLQVYEDLCKEKGLVFELIKDCSKDCSPDSTSPCQNSSSPRQNFTSGLRLQGPLTGGIFHIDSSISSQFLTGLLMALPLCPENSEIYLMGPIVSRPYITMTLQVLSQSGIVITHPEPRHLIIPGRQHYNLKEAWISPDASAAIFPAALQLLGAAVEFDASHFELQGDRCYPELLCELLENPSPVIDLSNCPDLGPMLFALAGCLHGATFTGTARLHDKESNRVEAIAQEIAKMGIPMTETDDRVTVFSGTVHAPAVPLSSHGDHRIAMTLSVLLSLFGGTLCGAEAVRKSWPDFYSALANVGVQMEKTT